MCHTHVMDVLQVTPMTVLLISLLTHVMMTISHISYVNIDTKSRKATNVALYCVVLTNVLMSGRGLN